MAKPDINLKNPIVKEAIIFFQNKAIKALDVPQRVESAVIPIYHTPKLKRKPVQIGSGVLVKIKSEYFIFSASHVFDDIGSYQLLIGDGTGSKVQSLSGERFSSSRGKSGTHRDDPIDASVFHIQSPISEALKKDAITLSDFDFSSFKESESMFIAAGFRVKESNTAGNTVRSKREGFPSVEISVEDYLRMKIDPKIHITLHYEDQMLLNGTWKTSPKPKGFSGGAIIRVDGITVNPSDIDKQECKQLLTGIIIEQRREKNKEIGILLGTKVDIHLALIKWGLPELAGDIDRHIEEHCS
ncbi:hypothetical protein DN398_25365 [Bacillus sp. JAS102]|uniref:hypothetical protein n=1 Tax=Bacillus sp. JAS102 TaxID=2217824 RepID=UPI0011EF3ED9|nr:hypothetical protein [Bacillus sp. JAS102]KAA0796728.1 hypothetical protein DN398_25365 [Bacillus sp. JAS102]